MRFEKFEAAGNDFLLVEGAEYSSRARSPKFIRALCERNFGVGADGIVVIGRSETGIHWHFLNADASEAEFCGNAARALTAYLLRESKSIDEVKFQTRIGPIIGRRSDPKGDHYCVEVPVSSEKLSLLTEIEAFARKELAELISISHWNSGVPHLLLHLPQLPEREVREKIARELYFHPATPPARWNISWLASKSLEAVTFERGVEGETLACGSGALAAFLGLESESAATSVELQFPGGRLSVKRLNPKTLALTGRARAVFTGDFPDDDT